MEALSTDAKKLYKHLQAEQILHSAEAGSIPDLMKKLMRKLQVLEKDHMHPISAMIYEPDGSFPEVKDVKDLLLKAAADAADVQRAINEVKQLLKTHQSQMPKKHR